ncbi:MAG: hypothetical protein LBS17_01935 [Actinomycetes bacterium]|jgi:hypothetical protein|nr:hypothetical protein [Actinomycetes bacterium]
MLEEASSTTVPTPETPAPSSVPPVDAPPEHPVAQAATQAPPQAVPATMPAPAMPEPKQKSGGKAHIIYISIIAVLAVILLVIIGLFAFGRIMFVPSGVRQFRGGAGQSFRMTDENGNELSQEEIEEMRENGELPGPGADGQGQPPQGGNGDGGVVPESDVSVTQ